MNSLVEIQHWLYGGMASGLGEVAGGDPRAIFAAIAAAVLFGAVHALMPGHGKTVLVSYHLGQPAGLREGIANGAILALTHVGLALILVLAGFAVISRAFAYGGRTPQFEVASAMTLGMIATIGGIALAAAFARERFMGLLDRTQGWRHRLGTALEVGGSLAVLAFGLWTLYRLPSPRRWSVTWFQPAKK